jgi:hypothetical protein
MALTIGVENKIFHPSPPPFRKGRGETIPTFLKGDYRFSWFVDDHLIMKTLFKNEALIEEIRIIEVNPADEFNGMVTPLSHAPDAWNPHGE